MFRKLSIFLLGLLLVSPQLLAVRGLTKQEECLQALTKSTALNLEYKAVGEGLVMTEVAETSPKITVLTAQGRVVVNGKSCSQDSDLNSNKVAVSLLKDAYKKMNQTSGIPYPTLRRETLAALNACKDVENVEISQVAKEALKAFEGDPRKQEQEFNKTPKMHGPA